MRGMCRYGSAALVIALVLVGCQTTKNIQDSVTTTTKNVTSSVKTFIYDIDEDLYAQVPADRRIGVAEAEESLLAAEERAAVAELREERAVLRRELAGYVNEIAALEHDIARTELNRLKWDAIERAGLGKSEENRDHSAKLRGKTVEWEAEIADLEADMNVVRNKLESVERELAFQEKRMAGGLSALPDFPARAVEKELPR